MSVEAFRNPGPSGLPTLSIAMLADILPLELIWLAQTTVPAVYLKTRL